MYDGHPTRKGFRPSGHVLARSFRRSIATRCSLFFGAGIHGRVMLLALLLCALSFSAQGATTSPDLSRPAEGSLEPTSPGVDGYLELDGPGPQFLFDSGAPVVNPFGVCGSCYAWSSTYVQAPNNYDRTARAFNVPAGSTATAFRVWWSYGNQGPYPNDANRGGSASDFTRISIDLYDAAPGGGPGSLIANLDGAWAVLDAPTHYKEYRLTTPYTFTGTSYFVSLRAETTRPDYNATILWLMCASQDPFVDYESYDRSGGSTAGWQRYTSLSPCPADQNFGLQVLTASRVTPEPPQSCIFPGATCLTVPFAIDREDPTPMRLYHVTFHLSPLLRLCSGMASITEGTYLSGVGATNFQKLDNGGGSYTVDCAILGTPCGAIAAAGTLFNVAVTNSGGDGTGTITVDTVVLRDCDNGTISSACGSPASITIDNTPPIAVSDLTATQVKSGNDADGTTKINLSFTPPSGSGYLTTDIYRKGFGNYPEYDDAPDAGAVPAIPASPAAANAAGWTAIGSSGTGTLVDEVTTRDFYYFVAFSRDVCGNVSPVSNRTDGTLNYYLGDVSDGITAGHGNNAVLGEDISLLGGQYGTALGLSDLFGYLDVGPTTDYSVDARPTTDNVINFEDLIMFAINYGQVSEPRSVATQETPPALQLSWEGMGSVTGTATARLILKNNEGGVKGIHALVSYDSRQMKLVSVTQGALANQEGVFFRDLSDPAGLVVDAAKLGNGLTFQGNGELALLRFQVLGSGRPSFSRVDLRGVNNEFLNATGPHALLQGRGVPASLSAQSPAPASREALGADLGAHPNPFTHQTEIRYRLDSESPVSLRIFDASGRLVRTLTDGKLAAGEHAAIWDGRTEDGRVVNPGVYFYAFQANGILTNRKIIVMR